MAYLDVSRIASWHAHVYFDATNRDDAAKFREVVAAQFGEKVQIGRFHEREVGPHPKWSFQIAFAGGRGLSTIPFKLSVRRRPPGIRSAAPACGRPNDYGSPSGP